MIDPQRVRIHTELGDMYYGLCEDVISEYAESVFRPVNLIFTSPPFPLNRAKKYGNMTGKEYLEWISYLAKLFTSIISDDGSIVLEIGNAWEKGLPTQSLLPIESLLEFKRSGDLYLCQEFIHYNPARLPAPVQWVNKNRIRVKDSFTHIWWLSKTPYPKANNRNVLVPYSDKMNKLLKTKSYNSGKRPSEYDIGEQSFLNNNGGAIPPNVITAANTSSNDSYLQYCKTNHFEIHPARMPKALPEFFIKYLTDEGDLVLDPFAGSNTTGEVAERLNRNWISIEAKEEYILGARGRFLDER